MAGGINNIGNLLGKVDSNNALVVALASGSTIASPTFTGQALFADGSAASPSMAFSNFTGTGWSAASGALYASVSGTREFGIFADQIQIRSGATVTWGSGAVGGGSDLQLARETADVLALRRSTNAQRLNLGQGDTALAAGRLAMGRDAAAAFAPGAGYGMLRWETGTNAGSLKLVAYSGTSSTGVTVIDNVGSGNA